MPQTTSLGRAMFGLHKQKPAHQQRWGVTQTKNTTDSAQEDVDVTEAKSQATAVVRGKTKNRQVNGVRTCASHPGARDIRHTPPAHNNTRALQWGRLVLEMV